MKIVIVTVGRRSPAILNELVNDYIKRLSGFRVGLEWRIVEPPKNTTSMPTSSIIAGEGELIVKQLPEDSFTILLDENGKQLSSPELAELIEKCKQYPGRITIIIGGPFGVSEAVKAKADLMWSLSRLVFPHQLVRLIVAEQLYRAANITAGTGYHHR